MNISGQSQDHMWKSRLTAARMAYNIGELHDAERLGLRALFDAEKTSDPAFSAAVTNNYLALICLATDRFGEAERYINQAEQAAYADAGPERTEVQASILRNRANLKIHQKKYKEAESLFARARNLLETCLPESALELAFCLGDVAWMLLLQRRFSDAMPVATEALNILTNSVDDEAPARERVKFICDACNCGGDEDRMLALFESTAMKVQYEVGPKNPDLVRALRIFSKYLLESGKQALLKEVQQNFSSMKVSSTTT